MEIYVGVKYDRYGSPCHFEWSDSKEANWGACVHVEKAHADYDVTPGRMAYVTYSDISFSHQIHGTESHARYCAEDSFWPKVYSALYRRPRNY